MGKTALFKGVFKKSGHLGRKLVGTLGHRDGMGRDAGRKPKKCPGTPGHWDTFLKKGRDTGTQKVECPGPKIIPAPNS